MFLYLRTESDAQMEEVKNVIQKAEEEGELDFPFEFVYREDWEHFALQERAGLANRYLDVIDCKGLHKVNRGYCCPWCDSVNPSEECNYKE